MSRVLGLMICFLSFGAFASLEFTTTVSDVDLAQGNEEEHLIFLSNGRVVKVPAYEKSMMFSLDEAREKKLLLHLVINEEREVLAATTLGELKEKIALQAKSAFSFRPTIIESYEKAMSMFKGMRRGNLSDSQCYNRAHVWAYDWKKELDVNSMKVWVFFTRKYIRRYNFDWWFHVSPYLYVNESTGVMERVMDYKFTYAPLYLRDWTNHFMKNDPKCPIIKAYSQYKKEDSDQWCYVMKTNMYYYQPLDMYNLEKMGPTAQKTFFMNWEVRNAYSQAFGLSAD